ncbi:MAG: YhfC family intramembrane metalloprotease [Ruminococcus sp.]|nr:YhfC family intramembrane metalloprotease [Ruminococcus sp.]
MENIVYSASAFTSLALLGVLIAALVTAVSLYWHKRTNAPVLPYIAGAATWFIFAMILENIVKVPILMQEPVKNNTALFYLIASAFAGIFEETGRFVTFNTVMKKHTDRRSAVTYGIGHGGFEALYIILQIIITFIILGAMANTGNLGKVTDSMDEAAKASLMEQLTQYSQQTILNDIPALIERVSAITFHISLSVLVFAAARQPRYRYLYPLAVFLHFAFDSLSLLYVTETVSPMIFELITGAGAAAVAVFAYRFYKTLPQEVGENERCMERNGGPHKAFNTDNAAKA